MCNLACSLCGDCDNCEILKKKMEFFQKQKQLQCNELKNDCSNCAFFVQEDNYESYCSYDYID